MRRRLRRGAPDARLSAARSARADPCVAACGSGASPAAVTAAAAPRQSRPRRRRRRLSKIPFSTLIAASNGHFKAGQRSSSRATSRPPSRSSTGRVDVLLESPYGGRTEPRIREHFDRLVDRISAYEVKALAAGRRLHREAVRAGVDRRAARAVATFGTPAAPPATEGHGPVGSRDGEPRHPDSAQPAGAGLHRAVPGPPARLHRGRHAARQQVPADDSERLPRRRAAARPRLRAAGRERVQAERAVARQGQGRLAVHARHGARERPAPRLVHRRAVRPGKGDRRRGQVPADARQDVRRRLAPGAGLVQRRPGPRAARHQARAARRLLEAGRRSPSCCRARRASTCR